MTEPTAEARPEVVEAKRVVVKVGSSSLTTAAGGIDPARVRILAEVLAGARARGIEVVLVSSGAIAAGLAPLKLKRRPKSLPAQQAAASVGQGLLVHRYTEELARYGVITGQVLLTLDDVTRRSHYRNAYQTFAKLLELGVLPIVNENDTVATTEIRFGDNDRLAALVAHLVHADLLVLLSDVDGLYDAAPGVEGSALVTDVRGPEDLERVRLGRAGGAGVGTGGMQTKLEAARIATGAGIPAVLTAAEHAGAALAGERVGTLFHATGKRRPTRLLWLAHATEPQGTLLLDDGAVRAVDAAPGVAARRRPHRGRGHLRRRRPGRHRRPRRGRRGPRAGQLRLQGAARPARPHRRAGGRAPRRAGPPVKRVFFWLFAAGLALPAVPLTLNRLVDAEAGPAVRIMSFTPLATPWYVADVLLVGTALAAGWAGPRRVVAPVLAVLVGGLGLHLWWLAPQFVGDNPAPAADATPLVVMTTNFYAGDADAAEVVRAAEERDVGSAGGQRDHLRDPRRRSSRPVSTTSCRTGSASPTAPSTGPWSSHASRWARRSGCRPSSSPGRSASVRATTPSPCSPCTPPRRCRPPGRRAGGPSTRCCSPPRRSPAPTWSWAT